MKLSVLDQSPISRGSSPEQALKNTVQLAKLTEKLGYTRFWVAEHHNTNGLASVSPEVLISHIASETTSIRIGSGGVLLPQYSPLKVAENFKLLEALFQGRIDRKSTRLNSSHVAISYAVFCLKKKNNKK